jgi:hypothetical protein
MKSENYASSATDEEIIELTNVVKSGPEAEEAIIDLTDPIDTVKAEPFDPSPGTDGVSLVDDELTELSEEVSVAEEAPEVDAASPNKAAATTETDAPMDLDEIVIDNVEELVDLTEPIDPPADTVALEASEEISGEGEEILDLGDAFAEEGDTDAAAGAGDALDIDLVDAVDAPESETMMLDLDDAPQDDGVVLDQPKATDAPEEIEADSEVLDLAEVLDSAESEEAGLDSDSDAAPWEADAWEADRDAKAAPAIDEALEVIEAEPVELTDAFLDDDQPEAMAPAEPIMDLDQPLEAAATDAPVPEASTESAGLPPLADEGDEGDDLVFELDEMLAEAKADMPDLDDDGTEMELDLSEALADAAAEAGAEAGAEDSGADTETVLDLEDPVDTTPTASDEDVADLDLISADNIIDLEEMTASEDIAEVTASPVDSGESALDNVINLADVTGGYPTVPPASEAGSAPVDETNDQDGDLASEDQSLDAEAGAAEDELASEMQKLEARLDDVFQDDDEEDLLSEDMGPGAMSMDEVPDEEMLVEDAAEADSDEISLEEAAADTADADDANSATAIGATAMGAAAAEADGAEAGSKGDAALHTLTDIPEEALDAAVARVIKTMYADRIEQMILDVIKEAVTAEIEKVKRSLGDTRTDDPD